MRRTNRWSNVAAAVLLGLGAPLVGSAEGAEDEPRIVLQAPSGDFRIEWQPLGPLRLVPKDGGAVDLPSAPVVTRERDDGVAGADKRERQTGQLRGLPRLFLSPDERWLYVMQKADASLQLGLLYRRESAESGASPWRLAAPERLDTLALRFLSRELKIAEELVATLGDLQPRKSSALFIAWSADSKRLLLRVSGWLDDWTPERGNTKLPGAPLFCYFNTGRGVFELTDRLRTANTIARTKRSHIPAEEMELIASWPLEAEAEGSEGPWTPVQQRLDEAERGRHELFQTLLAQVPAAQRPKLKQEEQAWEIDRETAADLHVIQTWGILRQAREIEGRAIATEKRVAELQGRLAGPRTPGERCR